jgi:hypothetical protein
MYSCKHCNAKFDYNYLLGGHITKVHSERKYLLKKRRIFYKCEKCKKDIDTFLIFNRKTKKFRVEKKYCSRSCANSREWSNEIKNKISIGVENSKKYKDYVLSIRKNTKCKNCGKEIEHARKKRMTCSIECKKTLKILGSIKGGRISASRVIKRSKAEIYFFELCKKHFSNVSHNEPIFDGWDADIILHDLKIAVLYNGKWHYEKITEKHSLFQVKNRDKLKIKKIIDCGFFPYIIKDMGRFNKDFVDKEFSKFRKKISANKF